MHKILKDGYREFLASKFEKGLYDSLIERLGKQGRAELFNVLASHILRNDPTKDKEFMDRVGEQLLKRSERVENE